MGGDPEGPPQPEPLRFKPFNQTAKLFQGLRSLKLQTSLGSKPWAATHAYLGVAHHCSLTSEHLSPFQQSPFLSPPWKCACDILRGCRRGVSGVAAPRSSSSSSQQAPASTEISGSGLGRQRAFLCSRLARVPPRHAVYSHRESFKPLGRGRTSKWVTGEKGGAQAQCVELAVKQVYAEVRRRLLPASSREISVYSSLNN